MVGFDVDDIVRKVLLIDEKRNRELSRKIELLTVV